jgi:hypothetical protein
MAEAIVAGNGAAAEAAARGPIAGTITLVRRRSASAETVDREPAAGVRMRKRAGKMNRGR